MSTGKKELGAVEKSTKNDDLLEERALDQTLRPAKWEDYVGQRQIKENLRILLTAAQQRGHSPEHLLFYGPPGLGKTTLAHLVARELGVSMKVTSGPAIEKIGDLASILTNLTPGDILFIDEIHRLNKTIEEVLYPSMESRVLDIIIGKGPSARTVQLELPPFTLIAATTRIGLISSPLRSRFSGGVFRLEFYNGDEIKKIIKRSSTILGVRPDDSAVSAISERSRRTPRVANYLLKRCRDFAQVQKRNFDRGVVDEAMKLLGVDQVGLTTSDRMILKTLIEKFGGGPVGLSTISASISEDTGTVEEVYEPYLMQVGFLERTPRGRTVTAHGYKHMGFAAPEGSQDKLI